MFRGGSRASRAVFAGALVCLTLAAVSSCVAEVAWLYVRIGPVGGFASLPLPVMIVVAGIVNVLLVREATKWSHRWLVRLFPLLVWALTLVCLHLGPGGNIPVPPSLHGFGLLLAGLAAPIIWLQWRAIAAVASPHPDSRRAG